MMKRKRKKMIRAIVNDRSRKTRNLRRSRYKESIPLLKKASDRANRLSLSFYCLSLICNTNEKTYPDMEKIHEIEKLTGVSLSRPGNDV